MSLKLFTQKSFALRAVTCQGHTSLMPGTRAALCLGRTGAHLSECHENLHVVEQHQAGQSREGAVVQDPRQYHVLHIPRGAVKTDAPPSLGA